MSKSVQDDRDQNGQENEQEPKEQKDEHQDDRHQNGQEKEQAKNETMKNDTVPTTTSVGLRVYFVHYRDEVKCSSSYRFGTELEGSISTLAPVKISGERNGTQERKESFRFAVVAVDISRTIEPKECQILLEGVRCLNCLSQFEGIISKADVVLVYNSFHNILHTKQLLMPYDFCEPTSAIVGLYSKARGGFLGCTETKGGREMREDGEANNTVGSPFKLKMEKRHMQSWEIWRMHFRVEGSNWGLLESYY